MIERTVNIAKNHEKAQKWDIRQAIGMTSEERQDAAKALKKKTYGTASPDVKEYHRNLKESPSKRG